MPRLLFETPRLIGRQLAAMDTDALLQVYGDKDAMRWVGDGEPLPREDCVRWVEVTENNYARRGYGMSALVLRESGAVIGFCGLVHPGGQDEAEIKYALVRDHWGQGLATEAVGAMLAYGVQAFELSRVIATIYPENRASQRVLEKVGMRVSEDRSNDDGSVTRVLVWEKSS